MGNLTMVGNPATGSQLHVTEDGKEREALLAASVNSKRDGSLSFPQMANADFPVLNPIYILVLDFLFCQPRDPG